MILAACSAPTVGAQQPITPLPDCSHVIKAGEGWAGVIADLGQNWYGQRSAEFNVNGAMVSPNRYMLQPGDVVALPPENQAACVGEYTGDVANQEFREDSVRALGGATRDLSGFKSPITADRINSALSQACEEVRWTQFGLRTDTSNLETAGCNLPTVVKTASVGGETNCNAFDAVPEALHAFTEIDLKPIKSFAVAVLGQPMSSSQAEGALCK